MSRTNRKNFPPGPSALASVRALLNLRTGDMRHYEALFARYGNTVRVQSPTRGDMYAAFHPDDIEHILVRKGKNFPKGARYAELGLALGQGLVNSEGDLWRRQRRLVKKPFSKASTLDLVPMICRQTEELLQEWDQEAKSNDAGFVRDINDDMLDITFRVAGEAFFGTALREHTVVMRESYKYALFTALRRIYAVVNPPIGWPLPSHLRFHQAMSRIDDIVYDIIDRTDADAGGSAHVLAKLKSAIDEETGERMDRRQLRDEINTILTVGHETSSATAVWGLYQISQQPEVHRRLVTEIDEVLGGDDPNKESLDRMPYLDMVFKECLRMMPSVPFILRSPIKDDEIGGYLIEAGSTVAIAPWVTHRHPEFWHHPERFDPERFSGASPSHRYAFIPFGAGPRICIGEFMAQIEGKIILAKILQRYSLTLRPGFVPICRGFISLQSVNGMQMVCRPRRPQARPQHAPTTRSSSGVAATASCPHAESVTL